MIQKLRQNYRLSNTLSILAFVVAYIFCSWQMLIYACNQAYLQLGFTFVQGSKGAFVVASIFCGGIIGLVLSILVYYAANIALNFAHIYNIPRAEYGMLLRLYFALGLALCGVLKIVNYFTPLFLVWGDVLFPFVSLTVIGWLFYKRTADLYFNSATLPNYFKTCIIAYAVFVVLGVIL